MDSSIIIEALVQVARKRRLLNHSASVRLGEYAQQRGIANLDDMRRWLASGDGLSAHLANELLALVPRADQPALGAYIPVCHLADGGMGTVWLACSPDNRLVVVKTLKKNVAAAMSSGSQGSEFLLRFEREARITQQLTHPNIVRCLDSGLSGDQTPFMVLEFVDSGDLKDLVERRGGLPEGLALAILYQVTEGLIESNRIRLVHRDIKPPNIFVSTDGRARLADFGIARSTESSRTLLTMEGSIVGSPLYMSPEQIVTDPNLDVRSDLYAMGAVLYYCLAAAPPFDGKLQEVLHQHCTASIPDIRKLRPVVCEGTASIIATCMQKERSKRYRDPSELGAALANVLVKLGLTPGAPLEEDTRNGDLSGSGGQGFKPAPDHGGGALRHQAETDRSLEATIASNLLGEEVPQATLAMDLLQADGGARLASADVHTMVANLLADDSDPAPALLGATPAALAVGPVTPATGTGRNPLQTVATMFAKAASPAPQSERIEGDLNTALRGDWLSLLPNLAGDPSAILLFARPTLCLGRLREPPTDLCLRNYPLSLTKEACQRASRQHLNLRYVAQDNRLRVEDLSSPNGTMLDGITLKPGQTCTVDAQSILVVAGVMTVWLRLIANRGARSVQLDGCPLAGAGLGCGIEHGHGLDAVVISRPENRPEMAYAMVLRQVSIGGPGADLVCAGARTRSAVQVGCYGGCWLWRPSPQDAWKPLVHGATLDCGGKPLIAQPGAYTHF